MITKTIGGDRLGSGKKMKTALHEYGRSTHNLTEPCITSAAPGMLIPIYNNILLNGDKWHMNINAAVRTLPTIAPLFGSFKLQIDYFQIPIRLYQGILHNNPINIGMDMAKVKLPKIRFKTKANPDTLVQTSASADLKQVSKNALLRYLGISGIGGIVTGPNIDNYDLERKIDAMNALAYYDIFKNYYSNKQETNAYVITPRNTTETNYKFVGATFTQQAEDGAGTYDWENGVDWAKEQVFAANEAQETVTMNVGASPDIDDGQMFRIKIITKGDLDDLIKKAKIKFNVSLNRTIWYYIEEKYCKAKKLDENTIELIFNWYTNHTLDVADGDEIQITVQNRAFIDNTINLTSFPLANIDKMRKEILCHQELGETFVIGEDEGDHGQYLPYSTLYDTIEGVTKNAGVCNGLVVKTYQSDLFNNWLNTDWIDGENGINEISAVSIEQGKLTMDALNLAQKIYNMLNRVAISGGTYDDWQEAVYGQEAIRKAETPIYIGGMSSEIVFEEVVSTADTEVDGETTKLGQLGGKGITAGRKGGNIVLTVKEPSIIMGIMSITPRLCYSQGNKWFMTEIDSLDDLHKPELDAIGYQNLMQEQMHYKGTTIYPNGTIERLAVGKVPAWINYMTAVPRAYGDFCSELDAQYMVLDRKYNAGGGVGIIDLTTYIDPMKFNYPFAYQKLDAQNFWVQINNGIDQARRVMSAKVIPNL